MVSIILFIISVVMFGIYWYQEIIIKDQTGPVFNIESNIFEASVKDDETTYLKGITAFDAGDGDVTDSIIVEAIGPFTGTGRRVVSYAAFDSDNHVTHAKRELSYTDYTEPRFSMSKPLSFPMNATNLLEGVRVEDCIDGDITRSIRIMSEEDIDTAHVGNYTARLKVPNSAGGVSYLPVTIEIFDSATYYKMPQLKLSDYIVYINKGETFYEEEFLKTATIGGVEYTFVENGGSYDATWRASSDDNEKTINYDSVDIESDLDTDVTGCYEIVYSLEDLKKGTGTGTTRLYVVVTEGGRK